MYAKIHSNLWVGTLYGNGDAQLVFIYLLAHCDEEGFVRASPIAICGATGMSAERVAAAIEHLEGPDPLSHSTELGGARLERIANGAWHVVNYVKYREIRSREERKRQNREAQRRIRQQASSPVSNGQQPSAMSAQVDVEADAEVEAVDPTSLPQSGALRKEWLEAFHTQFWPKYPRKVAKDEALEAWRRRFTPKATREDLETLLGLILDGLDLHIRTEWSLPDRVVPYPATWLNAKRYTDAAES